MRILIASGLAAALSVAGSPAQSQDFCVPIANYFSNPPRAFIAQRGEQLGPGRWRSNLVYPNSSCFITLFNRRSGVTHDGRCQYNYGASREEALGWLRTMEVNIDNCTRRISGTGGNDFTKSSDTTTLDDGTVVRSVTWDADGGTESYQIEINFTQEPTGRVHNVMDISYTSRQ
jgi:hypothetical protein